MRKGLLLFIVSLILLGCACAEPMARAPFTELWWDSSLEDMLALEGDAYESYDSVYGGLTYTYAKDYLGSTGQIKYMYDADGKLISVAWMYVDDSIDEVSAIYAKIHDALELELGSSGYGNTNHTNTGDVWYTSDAHVLVNMLTTQNMTALQFTYLCPTSD